MKSPELLQNLFVKQVAVRSDQVAVIAPNRRLTYGELHRRALRIAVRLRELGAVSNTLVGVVMKKGWEQLVATLGILYAGAAYLPIEADLPEERQWRLLRHGEVRTVLTQSFVLQEKNWPANVRHLNVDEEGEWVGDFEMPKQGPDDLAYVIYTSGSTGVPKGVMIDHRGAVNTILDMNERFAITPADRVLGVSSLSFDLSVYDIFGMLGAGGSIVLPAAEDAKDPSHWTELVAREGVTVWNSVPALMKLFCEHTAARPEMAGNKLRQVWLSGDWIPLTLPDQIRSLAPQAKVISLGGATEASIWSILFPIETVDPSWKSIPYGRAMENQSFQVLNDALEPCPTQVPGQLYIGGIGLAKGYWRDPAKTAERFIVHPRTGERLYRTGDLGRYLPDGNIEFLGREDSQVKIQGYRVELEEIEAALLQHPKVSAAVVAARGERTGEKRLVAYVISRNGPLEAGDLRGFLLGRLPEYMVPSSFMALARLPLTENGKVDRRALPAPEAVTSVTFVAPRTVEETMVSRIWCETLLVPQVGIHDNFYELGGHSLAAVQIISRLNADTRLGLPVRCLFEHPTVAELATVLLEQHSGEL